MARRASENKMRPALFRNLSLIVSTVALSSPREPLKPAHNATKDRLQASKMPPPTVLRDMTGATSDRKRLRDRVVRHVGIRASAVTSS